MSMKLKLKKELILDVCASIKSTFADEQALFRNSGNFKQFLLTIHSDLKFTLSPKPHFSATAHLFSVAPQFKSCLVPGSLRFRHLIGLLKKVLFLRV